MELRLIQIKSVKEKLRLQENHRFHQGKYFLLQVEKNIELFFGREKGEKNPIIIEPSLSSPI